MHDKDVTTGDAAIETLRSLLTGKADSYEIFYSTERGFSSESKGGAIDSLKVRSSSGVGIRTISNGRLGFGFSSALDPDALGALVVKTIDGSASTGADAFLGFPSGKPPIDTAALDIFDDAFTGIQEARCMEAARLIEDGAIGADRRIKTVRKASASETISTVRIVNSNGVDMTESATYYSGSVTAVAAEAEESQMGWEMGLTHKRALLDPSDIGRNAAKNAIRLLGGRKLKTVKCPAVIENTVVTELLSALAGSFLGDNVEKGKSMLIGKVGKRIASSSINIWDNGILPGGWASASFDGEGMPSRKTPLVLEGVCQGYLYDTYWAKRALVQPTGNSARSGYKSFPSVGATNLYLENGVKAFDDLVSDAKEGLFITEILGAHTINGVTGDFSIGAAGIWIEGGKLAYPVRSLAISGNLLELFSRVASLGNDLRFIGSVGSPSILIHEIEASGI